ncbi:hypothetical protein ES703_19736 [subsurface metagenome]
MSDKKEEVVSEALKAEEELRSSWHILTLEGDLVPVDEFNYKGYKGLQTFSGYEVDKDRTVNQVPPHVTLMKSLELVDYEPASDPGNMRYYPKGRMIKALLEDYVTGMIHDYGGMEVETPIMYNMNHPTLANYLNRFPARQYTIEHDDDKYFLRFAACFGQFLMAHDATISYRDLPLRIYELTKYSFRREQRGELVGLRRLRTFTMPDVHAMCRDLPQAKKEFKRRYKLVRETLKGIGFENDEFELGIRTTEDFYRKNKRFIQSMVKQHGKPALVEMWKERSFYFILKYELNFIDALGKASALATDQIHLRPLGEGPHGHGEGREALPAAVAGADPGQDDTGERDPCETRHGLRQEALQGQGEGGRRRPGGDGAEEDQGCGEGVDTLHRRPRREGDWR